MDDGFRVSQIDHVELHVPDRYEAAGWYRRVLGLEIVPEYEDWAMPEGGPLMVSSDGGETMLALFEGEPEGFQRSSGFQRLAFRVDAPTFLRFLERLEHVPVFNEAGEQVSRGRLIDHDKAYSVYFCDPYGNRFEVTTYDHHADVAGRFAAE